VDHGRRSDFILEIHPDLMSKLDMTLPFEPFTIKDCRKLKNHRECVYRSDCEWLNNKCMEHHEAMHSGDGVTNVNHIRKL
jgi:hypothetical protein